MHPMEDRVGRTTLRAAVLLFGLYVLNILVGKVSILMGADTPVHAGDVVEFLVLFAAVICFVIATLRRETSG